MTTLPFISVSALTTLGVAVFTSYAIQTLIMSVADQGQLNELSYRINAVKVELQQTVQGKRILKRLSARLSGRRSILGS